MPPASVTRARIIVRSPTAAVTGFAPTIAMRCALPLTTCTVAVPVRPSLDAVSVAEPAAMPRTVPPASTATIEESLDAHATVRPLSAVPAASRGWATSVCVPPTASDVVAGETTTVATAAGAVLPVDSRFTDVTCPPASSNTSHVVPDPEGTANERASWLPT